MTEKSTLVFELLEKYWQDECDAAGPTNVQDIVEGDIKYEPAEGQGKRILFPNKNSRGFQNNIENTKNLTSNK